MTFRSKYNDFSVTKENKEVRMFLLCLGFLLVFVSTTDLQKLISRIATCDTKEMQHYKILSATEGMCDYVSNRSINKCIFVSLLYVVRIFLSQVCIDILYILNIFIILTKINLNSS